MVTSYFLNRFPYVAFFNCIQQSNLFKAREEKYQSRIRVLEAIASGNKEESEVFQNIIV